MFIHILGRENTSFTELIIQNTNVMYVSKTYNGIFILENNEIYET